MHKTITSIIAVGLLSFSSFSLATTIGVIAPINIPAMSEITKGFTQQLKKEFPKKKNIKVVIENAQNDPELMHTIISQFSKRNDINIIAPIGTSAFENTAAIIKNKPILGIASELTEATRKQLANKQTTAVIDEINVGVQMNFVHKVIPNLKHITIIHSINAKIANEVKEFKEQAIKDKIQVQDLSTPQATDLYTISKHIDKNSQAVFILKDELIVSGMPTIVAMAEKKNIPIIASDDGSVQNGAAFALGVHETDIGKVSAQVIAKLINGTQLKNIPITKLTHYTIFVNSLHAKKQGINPEKIKKLAKQNNYMITEESNHG